MTRRLRSLWPYAAPLGFTVTTVAHPMVPGGAADVADRLGLWLPLHVVQIPLIVGLALTLWSLLRDETGTAAIVGRVAAVVFAPVYAAFDAVVGLGTGVVVGAAAGLPAAEATAVTAAADALFTSPLGLLLATVGGAAWLVAAAATAVVHRHVGRDVVAALLGSGLLFALTHVGAPGLAGALALVYATQRLRARRVARVSAAPATAA